MHPNSILKSCIIFILLFSMQFSAHAAHIVGGEITYECLGDGQYQFTLQIYRDCLSGGAQFDSQSGAFTTGTVSIFSGIQEIQTVILNAPFISSVPPKVDDPCLEIPNDVCVERGTYTFNAALPLSLDSYTITYSRCCRNNTINNIFNPESTGATYSIELTPFAQETCNNSPVFNNFPEIIICGGEPLVFDHSASDVEGDQLVYSFCSPFVGGGTGGGQGGGSPNDLNGVAPNPDAPPPYIDVSYRVPNFTSQFPLGGEPRVTIDPTTGMLSGTPLINGQFVVGVCVEEFRNGVLLSTVRRDFQFNVTNCDPTVKADIVEDAIIGDQSFLVNICGQGEFQFQNQSIDQSSISDFFWEFNLGPNGEMVRFEDWSPLISFPDTGQFMGTLVLNAGQICGDSATIFVNVFPDVFSNFEVDYDTCIVGPVEFIDSSFTGAEGIETWMWDLDDGATSDVMNPLHLYDISGFKDVTLTVVDNNNCSSTFSKQFDWSPIPSELLVQPSSFINCTPGGFVTFNNLTSPIDTSYDIKWNFGDGNLSSEISPVHEYNEVGTYTVSLDITSPFGCELSETFNSWISILQGPEANFTFFPTTVTNFNPVVNFRDESSLDVVNWQWDFANQGASRDQNPNFTFRDSGLQEIVLLVTAENGCVDTAFVVVDVVPIDSYFLPNAFTPNNDDSNDTYLGVGTLENIADFNMKIWNRWGELVFETDSPFKGWNGQKNNNGPPMPNGVYVVLVNYESAREGNIQLKAYSTLLR